MCQPCADGRKIRDLQQQGRHRSQESRHEEEDAADQLILDAEKFKASIAQPKG